MAIARWHATTDFERRWVGRGEARVGNWRSYASHVAGDLLQLTDVDSVAGDVSAWSTRPCGLPPVGAGASVKIAYKSTGGAS